MHQWFNNSKLAEIAALAVSHMMDHGLFNWKFQFDNRRRRYGACYHHSKIIKISAWLANLNPIEQTNDTILHEIAHALVGSSHGHDSVWRAKCLVVGCKPERCYPVSVVENHLWLGTCPNCKKTIKRHRRKDLACSVCCQGRFNPAFRFQWVKFSQ